MQATSAGWLQADSFFKPPHLRLTLAVIEGDKELKGENVVVELAGEGKTTSYRLRGQGISEQVGTSRLPENDLLDVLLAPMGLGVKQDRIVANF